MKKEYDDDDGRTITEMNLDGMPFYEKEEIREHNKGIKKVKVSKKERHAMVRAAYLAMLPKFLITLGSFCLVALLIWLWLK